jgi:hypothetical protein
MLQIAKEFFGGGCGHRPWAPRLRQTGIACEGVVGSYTAAEAQEVSGGVACVMSDVQRLFASEVIPLRTGRCFSTARLATDQFFARILGKRNNFRCKEVLYFVEEGKRELLRVIVKRKWQSCRHCIFQIGISKF